MGIDTSKDWDDQEEEEDEAATLIKLDKTKSWECVPLAPAALEVITNDTMQGWRTTSNASEYVPFAPAQPMSTGAPRAARFTVSAFSARSWQQMMRARLSVDKTKSLAEWAEEEQEAAELVVTTENANSEATESKCEPPLLLGMRLRGGGTELGQSEQSSKEYKCAPPHHHK